MGIRKAITEDTDRIVGLLDQLGYSTVKEFVKHKMGKLFCHPDHEFIIYEDEGEVLAFMSFHFVPQIALEGNFAIINYFLVDQPKRCNGIGLEMERYMENLVHSRGCDHIQLHSSFHRTGAPRFYERQESLKHFHTSAKER